MEIHFDKEYLQQLYEEGKTKDKKYRFQPQMVKRYQLRIKTLEYVQNIEELQNDLKMLQKRHFDDLNEEDVEVFGNKIFRVCYSLISCVI